LSNQLNAQSLPLDHVPDRERLFEDFRAAEAVKRLWKGDPSLWSNADEGEWVAWLTIVERQLAMADRFDELARDVSSAGFTDLVVLGMGGSSLCPDVLGRTFGAQPGFPRLRVLDSTDPVQVLAVEAQVDLTRTLFFVSSKSGTTLEPDILRRYFFRRTGEELGRHAGDRFIAVTDPGSQLEEIACRDRYRHLFYGLPEIGGRYSALSNFGMTPAAAMGLDVVGFLESARRMVEACGEDVELEENPGAALGVALGAWAEAGRNKVTFLASPGLEALGAWLEQLIAESTGKAGKAIIPVDLEKPGAPERYGDDRVFCVLQLGSDDEAYAQEAKALEEAGQPVVRITCHEPADLGQEFFRWEVATAIAGAVMGINPFNQPDVEASKVATKRLTSEYEKTRALPSERPFFSGEGVQLFADAPYVARLARTLEGEETLAGYLAAHLAQLAEGDYLALLAYIEMNDEHAELLQGVRVAIRDARKTATCLGFGPRFLHSTGQAYKGGPNTGVVVQVTCEDAVDADVPGKDYSFGVVKTAQARGDFEVLTERRRRALRVHLMDVKPGLRTFVAAVERALSQLA